MNDYIEGRFDEIKNYSGLLAQTAGKNEADNIMANFRRAERLEEELSKYMRTSNDIQNTIQDFKDELLGALLPFLNAITTPLADIMLLVTEGMKALNDLGYSQKILDAINVILKLSGLPIMDPAIWEAIHEAAEFYREQRNSQGIAVINNILENIELGRNPFAPFQPDPQAPRPAAQGAF